MADTGITVPVRVKLEGLSESIIKEIKSTQPLLKEITNAQEWGRSILDMDFESANALMKRRAYDKEMSTSGDEGLAKNAAMSAGISDVDREVLGLLKDLSGAMKGFANSMVGFVQGVFGIVEDIYAQMKRASPLLETIENLFNLAVTLFFMPLGNKLAEVMLPAIIDLVDAVTDIWDKFEGKPLGEMLSIAINEGVSIVANYLMDLGTSFKEQGGIIGAIGNMLSTIGDFLAKDGEKLIGILTSIFEFIMNHIGVIIVGIFEMFTISISLLTAIQASLLAYFSQGFLSKIPLIGGLAPTTAGAVAGGAVFAGLNLALFGSGIGGDLLGLADGGYVPATPGGKIIRIAEGGEGEYVIPESKLGTMLPEIVPYDSYTSNISTNVNTSNMGGNITNNFYFEGLTNDDLRRIIKEEVDGMISQSKYRSGF